jgi:hypothetical protein
MRRTDYDPNASTKYDGDTPEKVDLFSKGQTMSSKRWKKVAVRVGTLDHDVVAVLRGFLMLLGYTDVVAQKMMNRKFLDWEVRPKSF